MSKLEEKLEELGYKSFGDIRNKKIYYKYFKIFTLRVTIKNKTKKDLEILWEHYKPLHWFDLEPLSDSILEVKEVALHDLEEIKKCQN